MDVGKQEGREGAVGTYILRLMLTLNHRCWTPEIATKTALCRVCQRRVLFQSAMTVELALTINSILNDTLFMLCQVERDNPLSDVDVSLRQSHCGVIVRPCIQSSPLANQEPSVAAASLSPIVEFRQCNLQLSVQDLDIVHRYVVAECIFKTYLRGSEPSDAFARFTGDIGASRSRTNQVSLAALASFVSHSANEVRKS